jgi:hypothetical protein
VPGDPKTAPPSYRYFVDMVARLQAVQPEQLTENSVLLGNSQSITATLKKVEACGSRRASWAGRTCNGGKLYCEKPLAWISTERN